MVSTPTETRKRECLQIRDAENENRRQFRRGLPKGKGRMKIQPGADAWFDPKAGFFAVIFDLRRTTERWRKIMKWKLGAAAMLALLPVLGNGCMAMMALMPLMNDSGGHGGAGEKSSMGPGSAPSPGGHMAGAHSGSDVHGTSPGEAGHEHGADDSQGAGDYKTTPHESKAPVDMAPDHSH